MIVRDHGGPVICSPADKVRRDREQLETKRAARAASLASRRSHDPNACRICGAHLTDPRSLERGIGPECWARKESEASDG